MTKIKQTTKKTIKKKEEINLEEIIKNKQNEIIEFYNNANVIFIKDSKGVNLLFSETYFFMFIKIITYLENQLKIGEIKMKNEAVYKLFDAFELNLNEIYKVYNKFIKCEIYLKNLLQYHLENIKNLSKNELEKYNYKLDKQEKQINLKFNINDL